MDELSRLWAFQKLDMEADRFEKEMRMSAKRQKLIKDRDFLLEQQNTMKKIEQDIASMTERVQSLTDDTKKVEESLRDLQDTLDETEPETLDIARKSLEHCQKLVGQMTRMEQELARIRKDSDSKARQQHDVRVRAAKIKAEFDTLKQTYDLEYREQNTKLEQLKKQASDASSEISSDLIARYKQIKLHRQPPLAILSEDRCGGCNMNLPGVIMRQVRSGAGSVECENCGRIVLVKVSE